jgi:hypothetical protein
MEWNVIKSTHTFGFLALEPKEKSQKKRKRKRRKRGRMKLVDNDKTDKDGY